MRTVLPEKRRGKLKKLIENQKKIKAVETVCGLEALAVTEAEKRSGNIFEAMWFSGLCCAEKKRNECQTTNMWIFPINYVI